MPTGDAAREPEATPTAAEPAPQPLAWRALLIASSGASAPLAGATRGQQALDAAADLAAELLRDGEPALRVAEAVVIRLEDEPYFNAGRGATLTRRGTHELDAAIVDGRTGAAGAVAAVRNIRNPVALARLVLESPEAVFLVDDGADLFARARSVPRAPQDYFTTPAAMQRWQAYRATGAGVGAFAGSVGVIVKDRYGNLAAATSSGGDTDRMQEQPDGAATMGAGLWADNQSAAVVAIGPSTIVQPRLPARTVAARLEAGADLGDAVTGIYGGALDQVDGTVLGAIDPLGRAVSTPTSERVLIADVSSADGNQE